MADDAVLKFTVELSATSSEDIKSLIAEAKQARDAEKQERLDLSEQRSKEQEEQKTFPAFFKRIEKEQIKNEKQSKKLQAKQSREQAKINKRQTKEEQIENEAIEDSIDMFSEEAESEAIGEIPEVQSHLKKTQQILDDVDSNGIQNLKSFASNPGMMIQNKLLSMLSMAGPYGAVAAAIVAIVLSAPEIFKAFVEAFAVKGGPLNYDFRFSTEEQYGQEFDRRMQFRRITGDAPIITVDTHGYVVGDQSFSGNSLVDSEITRTARISIKQKSLGYSTGI